MGQIAQGLQVQVVDMGIGPLVPESLLQWFLAHAASHHHRGQPFLPGFPGEFPHPLSPRPIGHADHGRRPFQPRRIRGQRPFAGTDECSPPFLFHPISLSVESRAAAGPFRRCRALRNRPADMFNVKGQIRPIQTGMATDFSKRGLSAVGTAFPGPVPGAPVFGNI